ncbi:hypothetical protein TNCV_2575101 [Trichonephila clavipes]|nr:hypothetical protein TNCV_2575101 [Trichonephila clavipes]
MCWDALGGKLLVETILRQTRTPSSVHSQREWDKLPQQLLDNVCAKYGIGPWLAWSRVRAQYRTKDPPCRAAMHVKSTAGELKRRASTPKIGVVW